jgi:hypothetical protein
MIVEESDILWIPLLFHSPTHVTIHTVIVQLQASDNLPGSIDPSQHGKYLVHNKYYVFVHLSLEML